MVAWLYFVQSNGEYHDLMSFLLGGEDFSGISYLVFSKHRVHMKLFAKTTIRWQKFSQLQKALKILYGKKSLKNFLKIKNYS